MALDEQTKKAFDFANEVTKQLITLSTAIIALTITFIKDILKGEDGDVKYLIFAAWFCFLAAVFFGLWTMLALTGSLEPLVTLRSEDKEKATTFAEMIPSIRGKNVTLPSTLQIFFFVLGLIATVLFGIYNVSSALPSPK